MGTTSHILHLFEQFGPRRQTQDPRKRAGEIDFRWEREWRIKGDFAFNLEDVAFGLCPEDKLDECSQLSQGKFPFIDPNWEYKRLREYLKKGEWDKKILHSG